MLEGSSIEEIDIFIAHPNCFCFEIGNQEVTQITKIADTALCPLSKQVDGLPNIITQLTAHANSQDWIVAIINQTWLIFRISEKLDKRKQVVSITLSPFYELSSQQNV